MVMREALGSVPVILLCTALFWCGCAPGIGMASGSRLAVAKSERDRLGTDASQCLSLACVYGQGAMAIACRGPILEPPVGTSWVLTPQNWALHPTVRNERRFRVTLTDRPCLGQPECCPTQQPAVP